MRHQGQAGDRGRPAKPKALGALALGMGLAVGAAGVAGCGGQSGHSSASTPIMAATTTTTSGQRTTPAAGETASCIAKLSPWTQYIADTGDFSGWVATVGSTSPVVQLPQNAAKVYIGEESKSGSVQASNDGFNELDQACGTFAATHPTFSFRGLPPAPTLPT